MTEASSIATASARFPWNKGKIIGAKPPLRPKHVWSSERIHSDELKQL